MKDKNEVALVLERVNLNLQEKESELQHKINQLE